MKQWEHKFFANILNADYTSALITVGQNKTLGQNCDQNIVDRAFEKMYAGQSARHFGVFEQNPHAIAKITKSVYWTHYANPSKKLAVGAKPIGRSSERSRGN